MHKDLEERYIVFKIKDIDRYLDDLQKTGLRYMCNAINLGRFSDGKAEFSSIVVEEDWPQFEQVKTLVLNKD